MKSNVTDGIESPLNLTEAGGFDMEEFGRESLTWITTHYVELIIATILAVGIFFLLSTVKGRLTKLSNERDDDGRGAATLVLRVISRTGVFFSSRIVDQDGGRHRASARAAGRIDRFDIFHSAGVPIGDLVAHNHIGIDRP